VLRSNKALKGNKVTRFKDEWVTGVQASYDRLQAVRHQSVREFRN